MLKTWSLSKIQLFEQCPRKFSAINIEKSVPFETSFALENGKRVHTLMENYLLGEIEGLPQELNKLRPEMKSLLKHNAIPEEELCLDEDWNYVTDGWESEETWWRGKTDARVDDLLIDLKTGRHYPDACLDQAELYSIAVFKRFEEFDNIDVEFWYSKTGDIKSYEFNRSDVDARIEGWKERAAKLFSETEWEPKENQYCKYCPIKKDCPIG